MLSPAISAALHLSQEAGLRESEGSCLHHLFEAQAKTMPEAIAVMLGGERLTYAQLNRWANRLAHFLQERGVGPESIVGVCLESGPEMILALLAVLKAGGAYLPLDPAYPAERLGFMVRDASVGVILTQSYLQAVLPPPDAEGETVDIVCLDTQEHQWMPFSGSNLDSGATADTLAYVIYTSGSTGQPKGVLLTHRGAVNNLCWRQDCFPLTSQDRMLQTYSFSFDPSVWAIFWPLAAGATLVLPRPGGIGDSQYLVQTLDDEKITVAGFGPAMLQALLAHPDIGRCRRLRHVFCGGEAMPPDLPRKFHALLPSDLHNVYGPTEATIDAAFWTVPRAPNGSEAIPIGDPVTGAELLVLDDDMRAVEDGTEGELYIAGPGLARGYLNRPELTAERFLPHPSDRTPGARLYRTGDRARRGLGGELHFLGRADGQIKLRGFRIETGEIEAALCRHPAVSDVVVHLHPQAQSQPGEARLVAYLVACGKAPCPADLRRFLSQTLPAHMIPRDFIFLPVLPLTPSGKRDRQALPVPGLETQERGEEFLAPQTPLQHQLAQIWEDLLNIRPVGIRDSFWELGGHSLLAARMLDQIARICGHSMPLSALYEGGTIEHLAEALRRGEQPQTISPLAAISPGGGRRPFFFLYGFHPLGGFYCCHLARHLHPEQPFFALHPPLKPWRARTIEGMAADGIKAIQAVQPNGPYRLGGFCGSGLIAYEMACQLAAQGQATEFLALVEVQSINANFRLLLRRLAGSPERFQRLQSRFLRPWTEWHSRWQIWKKRGQSPEPGCIAEADRAAGAYIPLPYVGPVTLLRAGEEPQPLIGDPIQLWREVAPNLTLHDIPGTHGSCLLEHVGGLGERLGACLDAIDTC